jgi:fructan beta-fructosidase
MLSASGNQTETSRRRWYTSSPILCVALLFATWLSGTLAGDQLYNEPFRPQFHFTPARNWMNDPNGLVYYKGEYHLFYQYNPFGDEWGHMSWGHAVSRDLMHWQHLPIAIPEANGVMVFSGSAVVDWNNSSGLCTGSTLTDRSCLIAIYTGYTGKEQNQNLAYSNDRGRTWTRYPGNPVIDLHLADFRDPKVFWDESRHRWAMVTALSPQHKLRFFGSTDLKHWTALSDFGPAGAVGGAWECPNLFQLPVEGEPGQTRWALSVNVNPGGVAGGSGDQYFVGRFDGTQFTNENPSAQALWADYGKDFYASTSFSDIPPSDGRRIWIGWLDNWEYAARVPTEPWRGQQSIPRALKLRKTRAGIRLAQEAVAELQSLRGHHEHIENQNAEAANGLLRSENANGETLEIEAEIDSGSAAEFGFKVRKGSSEETLIGVDRVKSVLFVDRSRSGDTGFDPKFPGRQAAPLDLTVTKAVKLDIFVDRCSVEVFANDGEVVISDLIFPSPASQGIEPYSKGGKARIVNLDVWNLKSVWN